MSGSSSGHLRDGPAHHVGGCCITSTDGRARCFAHHPSPSVALFVYKSTLGRKEERVKEHESKLIDRLHETFRGDCALVKSFAREPHESQTLIRPAGDQTMKARIALKRGSIDAFRRGHEDIILGRARARGRAGLTSCADR